MSREHSLSNKLTCEFQIHDGRIFVTPLDDNTNIFVRKYWFYAVNSLFDQNHIQKLGHNYVQFKQSFLYKDLKNFKQILENQFKNVRHSSSYEVYYKGLQQSVEKILNTKITLQSDEGKQQKKIYKDFILCYDYFEPQGKYNENSEINFNKGDPNRAYKFERVVINKGRHKHFVKRNEVEFRLSKVQFVIYYLKDHHSKIKKIFTNLEQKQQQWLLYPLNPYLSQFSIDGNYYEELIQKILIKKSAQIFKIAENIGFQILDKSIKVIKDVEINQNKSQPEHPQLQKGWHLGFHVFGQIRQFNLLHMRINNFFESRRMWILVPEKIFCCNSLADLEDFMKQKEGLETYLISDHIVAIIKSQQDINKLTSLKNRQKMNQNNTVTEEQRLLDLLQTGEFTIDINDYDKRDLEEIFKERVRYKEYLHKQHEVVIQYCPTSRKREIKIITSMKGYRVFKGNIYSFINDFKTEKEQLKQFRTEFHIYVFQTHIRAKLQKQFPQIKFKKTKKKNLDQVWVKFHAKDKDLFMERMNEIMKKLEYQLDYIVCKKQPISQNWFIVYRRPHLLSIHTLTCRKYLISKDTKVYVQPYQSLSRPIQQMLFLIDESFQNCWEFVQIAEKNDINLMSLFLEFQEKKTKKPDRIKAIPLSNHRYISKMVLWYNDMLKKIQNRREQDIKKLYKRYEDKREMNIMIPRHATSTILLHFLLPSLIREFTHQTGYNLKQIFFYYPVLFDEEHRFVQNITLKVVDQEMRKANIELQNENYLTKESIKKILQMEYIILQCSFEGDQRIWKASQLSSYMFFIERELMIQRKASLSRSATPDVQVRLMNFKVPLFFMDSSFNNEIVVDITEGQFYKIGKITVQGPFQIKSDKKYEEISKCVYCIKNIFISLSYVVLYVDKDFRVSKNGYYYSHRDFVDGKNVIPQTTPIQPARDFKKLKPQTSITFNANANNTTMKSSVLPPNIDKNKKESKSLKMILYPMKLQVNECSNRRVNYDESGKILKRQSKKLIISMIQSEPVVWYMAETCRQKMPQLEQYLRNPNNFKEDGNILVGEISEYSILDLNQSKEKSRLLDFQQEIELSKDKINRFHQHTFIDNDDFGMKSLDLSAIHLGDIINESLKNNLSDKMSFLQLSTQNVVQDGKESNDMSMCSSH